MDKLQKITAVVLLLLLLSLLVINTFQLKAMVQGVGFGKKKPCGCGGSAAATDEPKYTEGAVSEYGPIQ